MKKVYSSFLLSALLLVNPDVVSANRPQNGVQRNSGNQNISRNNVQNTRRPMARSRSSQSMTRYNDSFDLNRRGNSNDRRSNMNNREVNDPRHNSSNRQSNSYSKDDELFGSVQRRMNQRRARDDYDIEYGARRRNNYSNQYLSDSYNEEDDLSYPQRRRSNTPVELSASAEYILQCLPSIPELEYLKNSFYQVRIPMEEDFEELDQLVYDIEIRIRGLIKFINRMAWLFSPNELQTSAVANQTSSTTSSLENKDTNVKQNDNATQPPENKDANVNQNVNATQPPENNNTESTSNNVPDNQNNSVAQQLKEDEDFSFDSIIYKLKALPPEEVIGEICKKAGLSQGEYNDLMRIGKLSQELGENLEQFSKIATDDLLSSLKGKQNSDSSSLQDALDPRIQEDIALEKEKEDIRKQREELEAKQRELEAKQNMINSSTQNQPTEKDEPSTPSQNQINAAHKPPEPASSQTTETDDSADEDTTNQNEDPNQNKGKDSNNENTDTENEGEQPTENPENPSTSADNNQLSDSPQKPEDKTDNQNQQEQPTVKNNSEGNGETENPANGDDDSNKQQTETGDSNNSSNINQPNADEESKNTEKPSPGSPKSDEEVPGNTKNPQNEQENDVSTKDGEEVSNNDSEPNNTQNESGQKNKNSGELNNSATGNHQTKKEEPAPEDDVISDKVDDSNKNENSGSLKDDTNKADTQKNYDSQPNAAVKQISKDTQSIKDVNQKKEQNEVATSDESEQKQDETTEPSKQPKSEDKVVPEEINSSENKSEEPAQESQDQEPFVQKNIAKLDTLTELVDEIKARANQFKKDGLNDKQGKQLKKLNEYLQKIDQQKSNPQESELKDEVLLIKAIIRLYNQLVSGKAPSSTELQVIPNWQGDRFIINTYLGIFDVMLAKVGENETATAQIEKFKNMFKVASTWEDRRTAFQNAVAEYARSAEDSSQKEKYEDLIEALPK